VYSDKEDIEVPDGAVSLLGDDELRVDGDVAPASSRDGVRSRCRNMTTSRPARLSRIPDVREVGIFPPRHA
jgi:hypothetical protein